MSLAMIEIEVDLAAIEEAVFLLKYGPPSLRRPTRGYRATHPTTPIVMALNNRAATLRRKADVLRKGDNWLTVHGAGET